MGYQLLADIAVFISIITGIIIILWAIDTFIFNDAFGNTELGDHTGYIINCITPWVFAIYAILFIGYSLYIGVGINIDISINNPGG